MFVYVGVMFHQVLCFDFQQSRAGSNSSHRLKWSYGLCYLQQRAAHRERERCPLIVYDSHKQPVVTQCGPVTVDCYIPEQEGVSDTRLAQSSIKSRRWLLVYSGRQLNVCVVPAGVLTLILIESYFYY